MKKRTLKSFLLVAALPALVLTGCKKDDPNGDGSGSTQYQGHGTFILCEGAFNQSNARIDFLDTDDSLHTNIFQSVNGAPLGDVLQSMTVIDNRAYIVVNNSGKIEVVDPTDFKSKGTVTGLSSPRFVTSVSAGKAYVSDLFSGHVSILNTSNLTVTGSVNLPGWSEEMLNDNGKIWITNEYSEYTYIVQNDAVTDSVHVGYGNSSLRKDNNGKIWVLCYGNYPPTMVPSGLYRVDAASKNVEWNYTFSDFGATKLRMSPDKSLLYFLYSGAVYRKSTGDNSNPAEFIPAGSHSFYGLGVDPQTGDIWVGDAGDFSSAGTVYVYSASGSLIRSFTTGIAPSDFVF